MKRDPSSPDAGGRAAPRVTSDTAPVADKPPLDPELLRARLANQLFGQVAEPARVGRFVLLDLLGRGGMGAVYAAYDNELDRKVAVKVLRSGALSNARSHKRLHREAQALARLSHPNVVQIYQVGEIDGQIFLVMEFVSGQTLHAWRQHAPRTWREVLDVYLDAARGLAAAHDTGLIHRDFKPHNVIVGDDGRVRVLDFGLATAAASQPESSPRPAEGEAPEPATSDITARLTATGVRVGTPAYMSPEQHAGRPADERSDVFSLCASLYEGLYERRPFFGRNLAELAVAVTEGDVAPPPQDSDVPRWLRDVVVRGLAPDPAERWPSVAALIAALERDPARRARRLRVGAALIACIIAIVVGAGWLVSRAGDRAEQERQAKALAESERDRAFDELQVQAMRGRDALRVGAARDVANDPTLAVMLLREVEDPSTAYLWDYQASIALGGRIAHLSLTHGEAMLSIAFSPDGARVVTAGYDNTARIWNVDGVGEPVILAGHTHWVQSAEFSPDGERVVTASHDGSAQIWNADGSGAPIVLTGHSAAVLSAEFSRDGAHIVTASRDHTVRLWRADGTGASTIVGHHPAAVHAARITPDGARIVTASHDQLVRVWPVGGGAAAVLRGHDGPVTAARVTADGARIVTGSGDGTARIWPIDGAEATVVLRGHRAGVVSAEFSRDGARVITASSDRTARIWNADGTGEPAIVRHHYAPLSSATFSRDGAWIGTSSLDVTARVWRADFAGAPVVLRGHDGAVTHATFSPDGAHIATSSADATARLWDARGRAAPVVITGHTADVQWVAFSPQGDRIATASRDGTARIWRLDGALLSVLRGHTEAVTSVAFSRDGARVVTASEDRTARIWTADGAPLGVLSGHVSGLYTAAFDPSGARVITTSADSTTRIWSTRDHTPVITLTDQSDIPRNAMFSPDGATVLASNFREVAMWRADGSEVIRSIATRAANPASSAVFSPHGRRVVISADRTAQVWNSDGRGGARALLGHDDLVVWGEFSPDGQRIVTASLDGTARVWSDIEPWESLDDALWTAPRNCLIVEYRMLLLGISQQAAEADYRRCVDRVAAALR